MARNAPREPDPIGGTTVPEAGRTATGPGHEKVPGRTRMGGLWVALAGGAVILVLLLVFILQNDQHVEIHLYGAHFNAPLGAALLMAAALGVLLVVVPGAGRIIQLRRKARSLHQDREHLRQQIPQAPQAPQVSQPPQAPPQVSPQTQAPPQTQVWQDDTASAPYRREP